MKELYRHKIITICSNVLFILLSVVFGFICVVLPPYIIPNGIKTYDTAPLFPFIATAIENFAFYPTMTSLLVIGVILGYFKPRIWWLLGIFSMSLFPVVTILEIKYSPTSHNLWPFEFVWYGISNIPTLIGTFIGSRFGKRNLKPTKK